ncbi:hypothetical protein H8356DRAFT_1328924 [Neocallimastix lanati (nom. inval.)]|nr:hypothetical protein H8356DRAFT_1328924 [Neocallimastix sp. JGI-2020a]
MYIINVVKTITFNALAFSYSEGTEVYSILINGFNKYSRQNNLDIDIHLNLLTIYNSSNEIKDYRSTLDFILQKDYERYDFIFYDLIYSSRFGSNLLDLKNIIPEEIKEYNPKFINSTGYYKNKLVGLPVFLDFFVLYYNEPLLNKYNQKVPKTWNELYDTGKYIMEKEKKNNNNIIIYNGFFPAEENGFSSLYELIYSYREFVNSTFPDLNSLSTENAFKMIKKIKDDLSSDEIFQMKANFAMNCLDEENSLFIKFVNTRKTNSIYKKTILPGVQEGISGATIIGYNIGSVLSPITSLYGEEEVCQKIDCEIYKNIQPVFRPTSMIDYENYSNKYLNYFSRYLFKNDSLHDSIRNIIDITKIHSISIGTSENIVGLFTAISIFLILAFSFLSVCFLEMGTVTVLKCHFIQFIMSGSFTLTVVPILYKLIIDYPKEIKLFEWISSNRYYFLLFFSMFDILFNLLTIISPFKVIDKIIPDGQNYQVCSFSVLGNIILTIIVIFSVSNYAFIFYLGINMEVCDKNWSKKTINVNKVKYNIDISINTSSVANREDFTNFYDTSTTTDY